MERHEDMKEQQLKMQQSVGRTMSQALPAYSQGNGSIFKKANQRNGGIERIYVVETSTELLFVFSKALHHTCDGSPLLS